MCVPHAVAVHPIRAHDPTGNTLRHGAVPDYITPIVLPTPLRSPHWYLSSRDRYAGQQDAVELFIFIDDLQHVFELYHVEPLHVQIERRTKFSQPLHAHSEELGGCVDTLGRSEGEVQRVRSERGRLSYHTTSEDKVWVLQKLPHHAVHMLVRVRLLATVFDMELDYNAAAAVHSTRTVRRLQILVLECLEQHVQN